MALTFYEYFIIPIISKSSKSFVRQVIITTHILLIEEGGTERWSSCPHLTTQGKVTVFTVLARRLAQPLHCQASPVYPRHQTLLVPELATHLHSPASDSMIVQLCWDLEESQAQKLPLSSSPPPPTTSQPVCFDGTSWLFRNNFYLPLSLETQMQKLRSARITKAQKG